MSGTAPREHARGDATPRGGLRLLRRLSAGPVTELHEAEQLPLGRRVLVRRLSAGVSPDSPHAAVLLHEARVLAALDHPGIQRLIDYRADPEQATCVLERPEGWSLAELLGGGQRLAPSAVLALGLGAAEALAHAHSRGVVHRGITPGVLYVAPDGRVRLTGFSAASLVSDGPTLDSVEDPAGFAAPAYLSPEQLLGEPEDPRSDLFSLGVVLYEALAGARPFDRADSTDPASQRSRHERPAPLGERAPRAPLGVERLLLCCLEALPDDRPSSARELAIDLSRELRALGEEDPESALVGALSALGRVEGGDPRAHQPPEPRRPRGPAKVSTARALVGQGAALVALLAGLAAIRLGAADGAAEGLARGDAKLPLAPAAAGYLRVVVDPWAAVVVDGEPFDTTPFARSIPLSPGTHYVRLEHPAVPPERRTVQITEGETSLLDVSLDVPRPPPPAPAALPSGATDPSTP